MSTWIEARKFNDEKGYWDFAPVQKFQKIDYNFMEDYPAVQLNYLISELFNEINIPYIIQKDEMSIDISKDDQLKLFGAIMIKILNNDESMYKSNDIIDKKYNRLYFYKALGNFLYVCNKNDYKISIS